VCQSAARRSKAAQRNCLSAQTDRRQRLVRAVRGDRHQHQAVGGNVKRERAGLKRLLQRRRQGRRAAAWRELIAA